ncbi:MAG: 4-hydroxy-tetrahydrodipicolinate synthase [Clostridia bacterium]|nr:4-hydroxy-tetrahydrodipicolinate synthase [Clostridia bacterium]
MKKPVFHGSATAMITPFDRAGELDLQTLGLQIERQIEAGTAALAMCATTGECATIRDGEWERILDHTLQRVCGRVPVLAGVGRNDTRRTVLLCKRAKSLGAQGTLAVTPYYNKTTQRGLIRHYETAADAADLPMILYNVPSRTGMSIAAETYAELAAHPNIVGTKEASGDFSLLLKIRALCPEEFFLYSGNDDHIIPILALGGVGVISTMANVIPAQTQRICDLWKSDREGALELQIQCQKLIQALFREINPIPVKAAMAMLELDSGYVRQPLTDIGDAARAELRQAMRGLGLL